jgi:hypothetical protein
MIGGSFGTAGSNISNISEISDFEKSTKSGIFPDRRIEYTEYIENIGFGKIHEIQDFPGSSALRR